MKITRNERPLPPPPKPEVYITIEMTLEEARAYAATIGLANTSQLAKAARVDEKYYNLGVDIYVNLVKVSG